MDRGNSTNSVGSVSSAFSISTFERRDSFFSTSDISDRCHGEPLHVTDLDESLKVLVEIGKGSQAMVGLCTLSNLYGEEIFAVKIFTHD